MVRKLSFGALALVAVLLVTLTALVPKPAEASTFRLMTLKELTDRSSAVVEGTVLQTRSFWNDEHSMIFTEAEVGVDRAVLGETESRVTVLTPGGTVGDFHVVADGFPVFSVGERAMLFLTPTGDRFRVTGYQFGHYRLVMGADGVEMAHPVREWPVEQVGPKSGPQPLEDLRATVSRTVIEPELRRRQAPFVLLNPVRTWHRLPVVVVDDGGIASIEDGDHGVSRTVAAINSAWNSAGVGNVISAIGVALFGFTLGDGIPMINFRDPLNVCTGSCLAATFTGFFRQQSDGSFQIYDADMVFNISHEWTSEGEDPGGVGCCGEYYVESVAVHETGHLLGLGNSNVVGATMWPVIEECDNEAATLEADDRAGIVALYSGGGIP